MQGFTLLEVIIAVGLSAFLLLLVYSTYFGINRAVDAASEEQETLETGRTLLELLRQDFRGALISEKRVFKAEVKELTDSDTTSSVEFVTTSSIGQNQSRLTKVGYFLALSEEEYRVMVRVASHNLEAELLETGTAFEISKMIETFNLEFYDGTNWVTSWDSGKDGKAPKQVKISIGVKDRKGDIKTFTVEEAILGGI
ncbi:MAG: Pseudopilin GspJ [Syntrophorhabdus sp. PtaU1.Bin050]|nr:MAG: Pseudopilin GspJ [Syntrophorhabdus sp. PtaU1.Bin050]